MNILIEFPATLLWSNYQRPQHIVKNLAKKYKNLVCYFTDWTFDNTNILPNLIVGQNGIDHTKYKNYKKVFYFSVPEKIKSIDTSLYDTIVFELMDLPENEFSEWKQDLGHALEKSHIIRTTHSSITEYLKNNYNQYIGNKTLVTSYNGVDLEIFDVSKEYKKPEIFNKISTYDIVVGYYGALEPWIDWNLLLKISKIKNIKLIIIGRTEHNYINIPNYIANNKNVYIVDKISVSELPNYLKYFDLTIYPFAISDMTDSVDPLKVWEYLSFGKPVLSTSTKFINNNNKDNIFYVVDDDNYNQVVYKAYIERNNKDLIDIRLKYAELRSWEKIVDSFYDEVNTNINLKNS
jgi:hypothetical protein